MNIKTAEKIVDKLQEKGIEAKVYPDYSGRGMFGMTTAGVDLHNSYDLGTARKLCRTLSKCRSDSMGLGVILY